eukprot:6037497-Amphidinium_carterae.2
MSSTMTSVSPLTLQGTSESNDRRTSPGKRRTHTPSTGYEPNEGTVVPDEELIQATTPRTTAKLRRTCSEDYKDPQFDVLNDSVVGFSTTIELRVTEMTQDLRQEIKSIDDAWKKQSVPAARRRRKRAK